MARNQDRSPTSVRVPAQVYLDAEQWARFEVVAQAQNRSRSAQLRELIKRDIEAYDADALERAA